MEPQFISVPAWGKLTGISRSYTYKLLAEGKLRAVKLGGRTLIRAQEGLAFLDSLPAVQISNSYKRRSAA